MKYVKDTTGRFTQRPHFEPVEIDHDCEKLVKKFLRERYGETTFPLRTDDLTILLERDSEDLDLWADLTAEGDGVEGVTYFSRGRKPRVCISAELSESPNLENRLRTTLAHEYGHVRYHGPLYQVEAVTGQLFAAPSNDGSIKCKRDTIYSAPAQYDWMEWQAWYACGAILMPYTEVRKLTKSLVAQAEVGSASHGSEFDKLLVESVREKFQVSADAARVRLLKLGLLKVGGGPQLRLTR